MVTFSALTGYLLTGSKLNESFGFLLAGLFLMSAGASVLNQIQEFRRDALMQRTLNRPIPSEEISVASSELIAALLIGVGAGLLAYNGKIPLFFGDIECDYLQFYLYPSENQKLVGYNSWGCRWWYTPFDWLDICRFLPFTSQRNLPVHFCLPLAGTSFLAVDDQIWKGI